MRNLTPGQTFTAVLQGAPEDIADELGVKGINVDTGVTVIDHTATGIVEQDPPSGHYRRPGLVAPSTAMVVQLVWDHDDLEIPDAELYEVAYTIASSIPTAPGPSYATPDELRAYTRVDAVALPDEEATRVLLLAERDIDRASGAWGVLTDGRKFSPVLMTTVQAAALSRATCAQAEYRLSKGDEFFVEEQVPSGEFATTSVKEPRVGPKAREELMYGGLRRSTVRVV